MELPPALERLSKIKNGMLIAVILALMINLALMSAVFFTDIGASSIGPFAILITSVAITFLLFYIFGMRDFKYMLLFGISIFLISGSLVYIMVLSDTYDQPIPETGRSSIVRNWGLATAVELEDGRYTPTDSSYWYYLEHDGEVSPYKDLAGSTYMFNVTIYSNAPANSSILQDPDVRVSYARELWWDSHDVDMVEVNSSDTNYLDGKEFEATAVIDTEAIYHHWYALVFDDTNTISSLNTTFIRGPLVGEQSSLYGTYAWVGALNTFCNTGMLFFIIVLLYWWMGKAKEQRKQWDFSDDDRDTRAFKKPEAVFSCTKCGADVTDDDDKCPKCGASFEDEDDDDNPKDGGSNIIIVDPSGSDLEIVDQKAKDDGKGEKKAEFSCSKCGADVYDSDKKCRECGEAIEGEEVADFTCTSCGADAYDSDDKCATCGEPFEGEIDKHACPHCNKEISEKLNFCPHCGKSISR
ncbi:MAG: zinc ribbon domain-containing protein [Thermoplasmata archaeon]|nr:zinc ribbon domain-containing protein [Thermoplasmata archaeon]